MMENVENEALIQIDSNLTRIARINLFFDSKEEKN